MSTSIILPPTERLQLALESIGSYDAPSPRPASLDDYDGQTDDLEQLAEFLRSALGAAEELLRTRAMDREDLAMALAEEASEGANGEAHYGVAGQFR